jgi:hypothetical protein
MTNMATAMAIKRDRLCTLKVLFERAWSEKITRSVI